MRKEVHGFLQANLSCGALSTSCSATSRVTVSCISVTSGAPSGDTQLPPGTVLTGAETYHCSIALTRAQQSHTAFFNIGQQQAQNCKVINTKNIKECNFQQKNAVNRSIHEMLGTLKVAQIAGLQFSPDLPCRARNKIPAILWFRDLSC